ncbi:MAG: DNA-binding response regulator [Burkholderiales bacterium]|nr:MAG: DNA-binding response regulator [Betaproteobacteria bacterium]TAG82418.1 MAG: DNA-binding response regulator [Burkholderiales bacterium]
MNLLIVEDDQRVQDFLSRGLRAEGYRITTCTDGNVAYEWISRENFSVVLLDVMLPGMNGIELTQKLRAERIALPILMLTAMDSLADRVQGLRCGADDYLTKPFAFEELLARIEALARRPTEWKPLDRTLRVGSLVFDRSEMRVLRDNQLVTLTAKELALLELLMSAPGRVFSRERILSNVWGVSEDPLTNVVDVYIKRLRQKIGDDTNGPGLIKTVRGIGYKLDDRSEV